MNPILKEMIGGIKMALENTPPELSADLVDMGLLTGGALLKNIDEDFPKNWFTSAHCGGSFSMRCNRNWKGFRSRRNFFFNAYRVLR